MVRETARERASGATVAFWPEMLPIKEPRVEKAMAVWLRCSPIERKERRLSGESVGIAPADWPLRGDKTGERREPGGSEGWRGRQAGESEAEEGGEEEEEEAKVIEGEGGAPREASIVAVYCSESSAAENETNCGLLLSRFAPALELLKALAGGMRV